jgi:hypothetical protein
MEKTTLGLIAALGAAAATPAGASAPSPSAKILHPTSVSELLEPVANPVETLAALKAQRALEPVEVADNVTIALPGVHHHHHHHHRRVIVVHHHHHHHHHQNN